MYGEASMRAIASVTATFLLLTLLSVIVPETASARPLTHTVRPGENLYRIALRYGVTVEAIARANRIGNPERIQAGQVLTIPIASPEVGARIAAPKPLRLRRGPKSFFATLALVAADTPLHIVREERQWYEIRLPDGESGWVHQDDLGAAEPTRSLPSSIRGSDIARDAIRYLGTPYRWGGQTSGGVDCSGFVFIVFSRVPGMARRRSSDYFQMGAPVQGADLSPGDLVFFTTYAPGPSHVGIYLGNRKFIHAASGAGRVMMNALDESYYAARYLGARRILHP